MYFVVVRRTITAGIKKYYTMLHVPCCGPPNNHCRDQEVLHNVTCTLLWSAEQSLQGSRSITQCYMYLVVVRRTITAGIKKYYTMLHVPCCGPPNNHCRDQKVLHNVTCTLLWSTEQSLQGSRSITQCYMYLVVVRRTITAGIRITLYLAK